MCRSAQHPHKPPATFCRHCGTLHKRNEKIQIMEKAAGSGQTGRIRCFSTRFGSADGAILRERGCFARERQVQGAEKCGTIKLQGGSVAMELRIAIVEDQKFEAQRLERLLRQAWGILSSATCTRAATHFCTEPPGRMRWCFWISAWRARTASGQP